MRQGRLQHARVPVAGQMQVVHRRVIKIAQDSLGRRLEEAVH
jgi:hypothetical protein